MSTWTRFIGSVASVGDLKDKRFTLSAEWLVSAEVGGEMAWGVVDEI
jgi:hypothetical protein